MSNGRTTTFILFLCVNAACSQRQPHASTRAGEATHPSTVPSRVRAATKEIAATRTNTLPSKRLSEMIAAFGTQCDSAYIDQFPDFSYYLRAKLSLEQWREVEQRLQQDGWTSAEDRTAPLVWYWFGGIEEPPAWWTPSSSNTGSYTFIGTRQNGAIKYENGFVFYWFRTS